MSLKVAGELSHKVLTIEAGGSERQYFRDLWRFRELFAFLAWRDVMVRYKQTVIGVSWSLIRPLLTMVIFTLVFGKLAKLPSEGVPYPILVLCAMLPWQFFASSLTESSNSLVNNANLVSKIYFPRIIVPTSAVIVSLVDFFISMLLLVAMMAFYQFLPDWKVLTLPFFILLAFGASMGAGLWLSALTVKYRDFRFVVPFMVQLGLYASPVGYASALVPDKWRLLYSLNPMVGVIDGFRWALLGGTNDLYWPGIVLSTFLVAILLGGGLVYFRKTEKIFADVI